jgi:3-methylcrotonyl-CoA carboxylase alpha subunit
LRVFPVLGIRTNVPFLIRLLNHPEIRAGRLHTRFIEENASDLLSSPDPPLEALAAAAVAAVPPGLSMSDSATSPPDPWGTIRGWGR